MNKVYASPLILDKQFYDTKIKVLEKGVYKGQLVEFLEKAPEIDKAIFKQEAANKLTYGHSLKSCYKDFDKLVKNCKKFGIVNGILETSPGMKSMSVDIAKNLTAKNADGIKTALAKYLRVIK